LLKAASLSISTGLVITGFIETGSGAGSANGFCYAGFWLGCAALLAPRELLLYTTWLSEDETGTKSVHETGFSSLTGIKARAYLLPSSTSSFFLVISIGLGFGLISAGLV
jgi:hypothetical protein